MYAVMFAMTVLPCPLSDTGDTCVRVTKELSAGPNDVPVQATVTR